MFSLSSMLPSGSLPELAESVRRSLGSVQAQIAAAWTAQHNADGSHGNVTATSMRAGQLGANGIFTVVAPPDFFPAPLDVPAGVSLVQITTQATFSILVYGIRQVGQRYGDILFIGPSQDAPEPIFLIDRGAAGPIPPPLGTEIAFDASITSDTGTPKQFWVSSAQSPVMLIYLPGRGTNRSDAWCIPQFIDSLSI
jgi:hypothetical protein